MPIPFDTAQRILVDIGLRRPMTRYTPEQRAFRLKAEREFAEHKAKYPEAVLEIPVNLEGLPDAPRAKR